MNFIDKFFFMFCDQKNPEGLPVGGCTNIYWKAGAYLELGANSGT